MTLAEYQAQAAVTSGANDVPPYTGGRIENRSAHRVAIAAMGLAGEAGEAVDLIKKYLGHGHPGDPKYNVQKGETATAAEGRAQFLST